ncbi:MAG: primosomal protein N' [Verrucomicrobiota bacterium]|jgi:primosomal protein N' (replication factor Y)
MIARVSLEIALHREFDYLIPPGLAGQIEVGSRVQVPFGPRKIFGCVTALAEESAHAKLKPILKIIGAQTLVTPKVLKLARWIADYYCCAPEIALKSVLPEAVRKEKSGWRERLFVRALPVSGEFPKLSPRQQEVWNIIEEQREMPLTELLELSKASVAIVRKLEDRKLVAIASEISERDPYAREHILPSQPLPLNPAQESALEKIIAAINSCGSTRVPRVETGVAPASHSIVKPGPISETTVRKRSLPHFEIPGFIYHVTWRTHDKLVLSPEARTKTLEACHHWHGNKIKCYAACVMPDHVHLLIQPLPTQEAGKEGAHSLTEILHSIKSFSAHSVNKVMKRSGPVWTDESFDRLIRSEADLHKTWDYIWNNPRTIGLVGPMEDYSYIWTPDASDTVENVRRDAEHDPRDAGATQRESGIAKSSRVFLLHGVTGSGKTEIYLQAIAHALEQGNGAIVLVPEISLTPQTVERFKARFSSGKLQTLVAVLHSHLSAGERHDEWHKIRQGRARIVIGARSAIFAPVEPLGLIIVDEEHEHSYKQEEAPRYHARDVAIMRGQMENAVVVLGSATPSLESYYNCKKGKYTLLELPERVDNQKMPHVRVVDMRQAARGEKGIPIFSPQLKEAITQRLEKHEQTILFLNRRGYSTSLQCPKCGYVCNCPNCSLALTFHRQEQKLCCHICGHVAPVPAACPNEKCKNPAIRFAGTGTQRVEETLAKLFPRARVKRMDSDTMKHKDDYRKVLGDFRAGKTDILVGTQMIAKGLHFPNVTLVGIIYADLALHQPDFRAGERTFQLLTQVAGRAGRGDVEGEVFVQAFAPFHPAIQYARRHDFTGFYEQEIEFREQLKYPPVSRVALLTLKGRNEDKVKFSANHLKRELEKNLKSSDNENGPLIRPAATFSPFGGEKENKAYHSLAPQSGERAGARGAFKDLIIAGPAAAPLLRAETFYRYQIMLRTRAISKLSQTLAKIIETLALPENVTLTVDIDPVNLG